MTDTTTTPQGGTAVKLLAVGLLVAAAAHVPGTGHHLAEAPYMGAAFVGFTFACLGLLLAVASTPSRAVLRAAVALNVAGIAAYAATRLVAFPGLAHDVGAWLDPMGVVAVAAEAVAAGAALSLLSRGASRVSAPVPAVRAASHA